jgi:hypothetical protein
MGVTNKRAGERKAAALAALICYDGSPSAQQAIVCDVSANGFFVHPIGHAPLQIGVGSQVRVVFFASVGQQEMKIDARGVIRWAGPSARHATSGFGVQLDTENVQLRAVVAATAAQLTEFRPAAVQSMAA